jgi:hypothetical protein
VGAIIDYGVSLAVNLSEAKQSTCSVERDAEREMERRASPLGLPSSCRTSENAELETSSP